YGLWASRASQLSLSADVWCIVLAGAGMGLMLGPASTDAVNRASRFSYGEATGITQTVRNYTASLGLAILGTLLVTQIPPQTESWLIGLGVSPARAASEASRIAQSQEAPAGGTIPHFIRLDFAHATRSVLIAMACVMGAAAVVAVLGLRRGVQVDTEPAAAEA